jgi:putative ABC transport system substrate-binding protein
MKKFLIGAALLVVLIGIIHSNFVGDHRKKIGVIIPTEHKSMDQIVLGLREAIQSHYDGEIVIDIQNAKGDRYKQKEIIESFNGKGYNIVIPVGTDVALAAMQNIKGKPIVALDVSDSTLVPQDHVTAILECSLEGSVKFIKQLKPSVKKISMVYSPSEKNLKNLEHFVQLTSLEKIIVQPIEIQTLADLDVLSKKIDSDSELLFISKDHLVVSGSALLAKAAEEKHIPFIASDEGSVMSGAAASFGNKEIQLGRQGGKTAVDILLGASSKNVKYEKVLNYFVFLNEEAAKKQGLDCNDVLNAANKLGYPLEVVTKHGK